MYIVCHYGEIGLKGKNRRFFEEKLIENIQEGLKPAYFKFIKRISGRIIIDIGDLREGEREIIKSRLKKVFGIVYFAFAYSCPQNIVDIEKKALDLAQKNQFTTFKVRVARSNKEFPLTSPQIESRVGEYILENIHHQLFINGKKKPKPEIPIKKIKVDLENPDITFHIEIVEKDYAFLYLKKEKGLGGLPVGVSGKAVCLLSGGIDSPVSAFNAMRRGVKIIFIHFYTNSSQEEEEKIKKLAEILNQYQFDSKLYFIPFLEIQKKIFENKDTSLSCLVCKRMMIRIAQNIALKNRARAIIMGDSIGQVADQTLNNIGIIQEASAIPIIRPVLCQDKIDIIKQAQQLGTYKLSIIPEKFYCQNFMPFHPNTNASLSDVKKEEQRLEIDKLVEEAVKNSKQVYISQDGKEKNKKE